MGAGCIASVAAGTTFPTVCRSAHDGDVASITVTTRPS